MFFINKNINFKLTIKLFRISGLDNDFLIKQNTLQTRTDTVRTMLLIIATAVLR